MDPYPSLAAVGSGIGDLIKGHIDIAFRRVMPGPNVEITKRFIRFVTGEAHPFGNFACVGVPADPEVVRDAIGPLLGCGAPAAAFFTASVSEAAVDQLKADRFERHGGLPAMGVDIDALASATLPSGYTWARVHDAGQRAQWGEVFARGYELPGPVGSAFAGGIDGDARPDAPLQYFWILKNGSPVATSLVFLAGGVAGIYGVATIAEERGKGLGAFATGQPLRIARELGYRVGVLQASEAGYPVYKRLGFADFGEVPLYVRMPE